MANLQDLINAIPDAQDGVVITSDYHNTIKTALEAVATELGAAATGQTLSVTIPPTFLPVGQSTAWSVNLGYAQDAAGSEGWIPLHLPDGAVIQQMIAYGTKTSNAAQTVGFVSLVVAAIAGGAPSTGAAQPPSLIVIDLSQAGNPFVLTGLPSASVSALGAAVLKDLQTVDNQHRKYFIHAQTLYLTPGTGTVTIAAIRVLYTQS